MSTFLQLYRISIGQLTNWTFVFVGHSRDELDFVTAYFPFSSVRHYNPCILTYVLQIAGVNYPHDNSWFVLISLWEMNRKLGSAAEDDYSSLFANKNLKFDIKILPLAITASKNFLNWKKLAKKTFLTHCLTIYIYRKNNKNKTFIITYSCTKEWVIFMNIFTWRY